MSDLQRKAPNAASASIDVSAEVCPMTFVRTRLALDRLTAGAHLSVRLRGAEARRNIAKSASGLGHDVLSIEDQPDGTTLIKLRRN